jgi:hypothetical protein
MMVVAFSREAEQQEGTEYPELHPNCHVHSEIPSEIVWMGVLGRILEPRKVWNNKPSAIAQGPEILQRDSISGST